ncbi:hypothetical protein KBW71_00080 [Hydrogenophaga aromaticivorans]|uniref:hypothetical protein n=1 Tax=Hydrogenophaga aromaticivorans TaxID=2610898 RepID=UPI001B38BDD3|nr:hypothetical protein [Hydrogenophaga aromaticivorans]MBQ0916846.1 hypothetical protein [Hydrogenophaga aromaticivorans]
MTLDGKWPSCTGWLKRLSDRVGNQMASLGYWREPLSDLQAGAELAWQAPGALGLQVWVGTIGGRPVARISRQPGHGKGCSAALSGWMWTEHLPGSGAAQLGVKESPMRGFNSVPEAKRAIKAALAAATL